VALNAVQAMASGGHLDVRAENVLLAESNPYALAPGRYIAVSLRDHGIGIPERLLGQIFDPYFTTKQKGSGLGLASAYSILRNHDGHIAVESQVGVGSTFTLYLPATSATAAAPQGQRAQAQRRTGRVLLMDDEQIVRQVVSDMLGQNGYTLDAAPDGAAAVELYRQAQQAGRPYDVVIMDLTVPGGMGGLEAVKRLREIDPGVRAIVSSGYSTDPVMANYREYGFTGVVTKPFSMSDVLEKLDEILTQGA
jgi:CheY-like chemotaxis protein